MTELMKDGFEWQYNKYGEQGLYETSLTKKYDIGYRRVTQDGRVFRYAYADNQCHAGFGAWAGWKVNISHVAPVTHAAGARSVTVTVDANDGYGADGAVAADELKGGLIVMNNHGGAELILMNRVIVGNTAVAAGGGTIQVQLDAPTVSAITAATSYVEVLGNPYSHLFGGLTTNNAESAAWLGVPASAPAATYYFWLQTAGPIAWICPNNDPGDDDAAREVYFQANGTIVDGANCTVEEGRQKAGFILENSVDGAGPPCVMLQISW